MHGFVNSLPTLAAQRHETLGKSILATALRALTCRQGRSLS